MLVLTPGKYQLKSLHEDIDLLDRKLAHAQNYETFASDADRDAAMDKLAAKRTLLVRKAQQMIDEGIEFDEVERPRSLRSENVAAVAKPVAAAKPEKTTPNLESPDLESVPSPYAGTSFDYRPELRAYKKGKARQKTA